MLLPGLKIATIIAVFGLFLTLIQPKANAEDIPANCPVTLPSNGRFQPSTMALSGPVGNYAHQKKIFLYGNEKLAAALPTNGTWKTLFDSQYPKFAYEDTLPWFRVNSSFSGSDGPLRVTLHQLDLRQNAQVSQSSSSQNYSLELLPFDDSDTMMKAAIKIPNPGCWQVTGHYKDQDLSFIVWVRVVQVDNHPLVLQGAVGSPYR
jgi:hypothetical protein